jgi:hypothetical protein
MYVYNVYNKFHHNLNLRGGMRMRKICYFTLAFLLMAGTTWAGSQPSMTDPVMETTANFHDVVPFINPGQDAPGDTLETFPVSWGASPIGLCYDPVRDLVQFAHESDTGGSGLPTVFDIDYGAGHALLTSYTLSALNPGWPAYLNNRDGSGYDSGTNTFFLPDFNGDVTNVDDNIIEMQPDGTILNAWETDGAGNDSSDGTNIDQVIDMAVIPGSPPRYFVACNTNNLVIEIDLVKTGTWWTASTWSTLNTWTAPSISNCVGVDYDADSGYLFLADFNSNLVVVSTPGGSFVDSFTCGTSGFNTGVTQCEGKTPAECWVVDFGSTTVTRCESIGGTGPWVGLSPASVTLAACAGDSDTQTFTVTNHTGANTTFDITTGALPPAPWNVTIPSTIGPIADGASDTFDMDVLFGNVNTYVVDITVTDQANPNTFVNGQATLIGAAYLSFMGTNMPTAMYDNAFCYGGNDMFYGIGGGNYFDNKSYDPVGEAWNEGLAPVSGSGINVCNAVAIAGNIYVPGGFDMNIVDRAETLVYSISGDSWSTDVAPPAQVTTAYGLVTDGVGAYRIGGDTVATWNTPTTRLDYFTPGIGWTSLAGMAQARKWHAAGTDGSYIYVACGYNGNPMSSAEVYDIAGDSWSSLPAAPDGRWGMADAFFDGKLWLMGGIDGGGSSTDDIMYYDTVAGTWTAGAFSMQVPIFRTAGAADAVHGVVQGGGMDPVFTGHTEINRIGPCAVVATPTPDATPTQAPVPTTGPAGLGIVILVLSGLLGFSTLRRRK